MIGAFSRSRSRRLCVSGRSGLPPRRMTQSAPSKAPTGSVPIRRPARSGKAQSRSSMARASSRGSASGKSSRLRETVMVRTEEAAVGDPEDERVSDPTRGAGDRDVNRSGRRHGSCPTGVSSDCEGEGSVSAAGGTAVPASRLSDVRTAVRGAPSMHRRCRPSRSRGRDPHRQSCAAARRALRSSSTSGESWMNSE